MRKKSKLTKYLLVLFVVVITAVLFYYNFEPEKGIRVEKWDNIYDENNIMLFYENSESTNTTLKKLDSIYKINEIVSKEDSEINKVLKTVDILNTVVDYDHISDSNYNNAYEILKEKGKGKKVSGRDMAIIERDLLLSVGFVSRVGEFRKEEPQFESTSSYYVVEYFSPKYKKWVMIDFINRAYLSKNKTPIAAIDMLSEDIDKLSYKGNEKYDEFKRDIKKYLSSYTIAIDNTIPSSKSNTFITYISSEKDIDLKKEDKFIGPTIFTNKKELFIKEPTSNEIGNDKKAYLVLLKTVDKEDNKNYNYVIGAFQNSSIINNYYLKIDDKEWQPINSFYYQYNLKKGKSKIQLSLDGKTVLSEIVINREV